MLLKDEMLGSLGKIFERLDRMEKAILSRRSSSSINFPKKQEEESHAEKEFK
jgi:hypothetical protein